MDSGIILMGEAAQKYVELQWVKFYCAIPIAIIATICFVVLVVTMTRDIWKDK